MVRTRTLSKMSKTELMDIGEHCSYCGQIDFLPFKCSCKGVFCLQHRQPDQHSCPKLELKGTKTAEQKLRDSIDTSHLPSSKTLFPDRSNFNPELSLKTTDTVPTSIETQSSKSTNALTKLKKLFEKSRPKKANATKAIVELSKLKSTAKGDLRIPQSERIYVWCQVLGCKGRDENERYPLFVSRAWPLGRALDSMATHLNLTNVNNRTKDDSEKLFLYRQQNDSGGGAEFVKMSTSERCNVIKDGTTVFIVRGLL